MEPDILALGAHLSYYLFIFQTKLRRYKYHFSKEISCGDVNTYLSKRGVNDSKSIWMCLGTVRGLVLSFVDGCVLSKVIALLEDASPQIQGLVRVGSGELVQTLLSSVVAQYILISVTGDCLKEC